MIAVLMGLRAFPTTRTKFSSNWDSEGNKPHNFRISKRNTKENLQVGTYDPQLVSMFGSESSQGKAIKMLYKFSYRVQLV